MAEAPTAVDGAAGTVRFGTAGWSYPDWMGTFYPSAAPRSFKPLVYYARFFDLVEINSSFYAIPSQRMARGWVDQVSDNPDFVFSAKLWRGFTHERGSASRGDARQVCAALDILAAAGRLAALLLQFPWSFKSGADNRAYLDKLFDAFGAFPLVLELRHRSWLESAILDWLRERRIGFCNVDQPTISGGIEPSAEVTGPVGYVRLHGRNYENWFRDADAKDRGSAGARYDYLYSAQELMPWAARIQSLMARTRLSLVIANNHPRGQAAANALELKKLITGAPIDAPAPLRETFPHLAALAAPAAGRPPAALEPNSVKGTKP